MLIGSGGYLSSVAGPFRTGAYHHRGFFMSIQTVPQSASNYRKRQIRLSNAKLRGTHNDTQWIGLVDYCGFRCVICRSTDGIQKDHIVPIYQGGCDCIENIQTLCRSLNASKGPSAEDSRPVGWRSFVEACV
jgi:5-methylcytosine-specific restriction endonuclease McrA